MCSFSPPPLTHPPTHSPTHPLTHPPAAHYALHHFPQSSPFWCETDYKERGYFSFWYDVSKALTAYCLLVTVLLNDYCLLLTTAYYLLLTTDRLLLTMYCSLLAVYYSPLLPFTAYCDNIMAMLRKSQDFILRSWGPQHRILGQSLGLGNMWLSSCGIMRSGFIDNIKSARWVPFGTSVQNWD